MKKPSKISLILIAIGIAIITISGGEGLEKLSIYGNFIIGISFGISITNIFKKYLVE